MSASVIDSLTFEVHNARALSPEDVASTFVPPPKFDRICEPFHTVIVGPRGSGKTTLLKMLQRQALDSWQHDQATSVRRNIKFSGVFVPTDRNWAAQISALGSRQLPLETQKQLAYSSFVTHVLRSLSAAFEYELNRDCSDTDCAKDMRLELVAKLVDALATAWSLSVPAPTFADLRIALSLRLSRIHSLASHLSGQSGPESDPVWSECEWIHLDLITSVSLGIDVFERHSQKSDTKWALLFDELEIAPEWIRSTLVASMRSVDSRIVIKLASSPAGSPLADASGADAPMEGHDYSVVCLWHPRKEDAYEFSTALVESVLHSGEGYPKSAIELLGNSVSQTPRSEWAKSGTAYHPKSRIGRMVLRLAESDRTFRAYLDRQQINPETLEVSGSRRARSLRKAVQIITVREAFRVADKVGEGNARMRRSRKNPDVYAGAQSLFAICEGNPRLLLAAISRLVRASGNSFPIDDHKQSKIISSLAHTYRAFLRMFGSDDNGRDLLRLLDQVGEYFAGQVIDAPFDPEPPSTIVVDSAASQELLDLLALAVNLGALVYVPDSDGEGVLRSLRGKRFRLTYLLAPTHQTPLRLGREISLRTVLSGLPVSRQRYLFEGDSDAAN